jgi:hypothetical protein
VSFISFSVRDWHNIEFLLMYNKYIKIKKQKEIILKLLTSIKLKISLLTIQKSKN